MTAMLPDIRRILAIRMGHIGDVVLLTPALAMLNQLFPRAEISALVRSGTEPVLSNHPLVRSIYAGGEISSNQRMHVRTKRPFRDRLAQIPRGLQLVRTLRRQRFDLAVDFTGGDRSALYAFLSGAPLRVGSASRGTGFFGKNRLYTHLWSSPDRAEHKVVRDAELLRDFVSKLGSPEAAALLVPGPALVKPFEADLEWARKRWATLAPGGAPRLAVHPSSRVLYKCWSPAKWSALIARLQAEFGAVVVITSGPESKEMELARSVVAGCNPPIQAHLGDLTRSRLAALIQEANLFLGVDTAPMHIAAAVGTRVVAVFGPSRHDIWGPWGPGHRVVRRPCPCLDLGKRRCQEEQGMDCLNALTVEEVFEAARSALAEPQR
jgi:heptosyltransferase-3